MDYLVFCRDKPDTGELLDSLLEQHWSFMDGYADRLKARGPTLSADGGEHTGSLHIVDLATPEEVEIFAYREPFYAGGAYAEVMIRRWESLIDRSMWDYRSDSDDPMFLLIAHAGAPITEFADTHRSFASVHLSRTVVYGSMRMPDGGEWAGFAAVLQMPSREEVEKIVADDPAIASSAIARHEIHRWEVGGRR